MIKKNLYLKIITSCLLTITFTAIILSTLKANNSNQTNATNFQKSIQELEQSFQGKIGVFVLDTNSNQTLAYRADERFPLCSSFKGFLVAGILYKSQQENDYLNKIIHYDKKDLLPHSIATTNALSTGMKVKDLARVAVTDSDNTASNLLLNELDGPSGLTEFMHKVVKDDTFRLDRWELDLNSALPHDERDTSSPTAIVYSLQKILTGNILSHQNQQQLITWLQENHTGQKRIRALLPTTWKIGDKTGTCGAYGTANNYAILWTEKKTQPIIIAIYTKADHINIPHSDEIIAKTAKISIDNLIQITN